MQWGVRVQMTRMDPSITGWLTTCKNSKGLAEVWMKEC
jgi:hypothetical protein